jgi:hypothetical protein
MAMSGWLDSKTLSGIGLQIQVGLHTGEWVGRCRDGQGVPGIWRQDVGRVEMAQAPTVDDRCGPMLGQIGGTAGKDDVARSLSAMVPSSGGG